MNSLREIIREIDVKYLFPCIEDLVKNGLDLSRFSVDDSKPSRQDITQFILNWFKYIGISADECRDWMIEFCLDVLSPISTSSLSQIRHSTKSNIKYIYRSDVAIDCGCKNNPFKAACKQKCPIYNEMLIKYQERLEREAKRIYELEKSAQQFQLVEPPKLKDKYKEQFEKAIEFIRSKMDEGIVNEKIVKMLNEEGFKSRTGKKWTGSILRVELKKHFNIDKDLYRDKAEEAYNIAVSLLKEGASKSEVVNVLNERGFKTRTGRKWSSAILCNKLKLHSKVELPAVKSDYISIKEQFKDQFEEALKLAQEYANEGIMNSEIVKRLNDKGFKTRTGKNWTTTILYYELKKNEYQ